MTSVTQTLAEIAADLRELVLTPKDLDYPAQFTLRTAHDHDRRLLALADKLDGGLPE
jgi:hypothetical protein